MTEGVLVPAGGLARKPPRHVPTLTEVVGVAPPLPQPNASLSAEQLELLIRESAEKIASALDQQLEDRFQAYVETQLQGLAARLPALIEQVVRGAEMQQALQQHLLPHWQHELAEQLSLRLPAELRRILQLGSTDQPG